MSTKSKESGARTKRLDRRHIVFDVEDYRLKDGTDCLSAKNTTKEVTCRVEPAGIEMAAVGDSLFRQISPPMPICR
jgi:hypothetical protein